MFAVLKTGGKQYRVTAGDMLRVELLSATAGETVQFNDILMVGATVGAPFVAGAAVQAEVVDNIKADKVITFRKRRRKHSSQRTRGHRQQLTLLRVTGILEKGADKSGVREAVGARIAARAAHNTDPAPKADKAAAAPKADKPAKAAAPKAAPKAKAEAAPAAKAAKKPAAKKPAAKKE
jgi:large subunit ribosomal protein L21